MANNNWKKNIFMDVKVLVKYHRQDEFLMSSGKKIFIEVKLVKLLIAKPEFPQGYRFKWIAFNRDNPSERVLFDNHTGKGPHWHENSPRIFYLSIPPADSANVLPENH